MDLEQLLERGWLQEYQAKRGDQRGCGYPIVQSAFRAGLELGKTGKLSNEYWNTISLDEERVWKKYQEHSGAKFFHPDYYISEKENEIIEKFLKDGPPVGKPANSSDLSQDNMLPPIQKTEVIRNLKSSCQDSSTTEFLREKLSGMIDDKNES